MTLGWCGRTGTLNLVNIGASWDQRLWCWGDLWPALPVQGGCSHVTGQLSQAAAAANKRKWLLLIRSAASSGCVCARARVCVHAAVFQLKMHLSSLSPLSFSFFFYSLTTSFFFSPIWIFSFSLLRLLSQNHSWVKTNGLNPAWQCRLSHGSEMGTIAVSSLSSGLIEEFKTKLRLLNNLV